MFWNVGIDEDWFYALDPSLPIDYNSDEYEHKETKEEDYDDQE